MSSYVLSLPLNPPAQWFSFTLPSQATCFFAAYLAALALSYQQYSAPMDAAGELSRKPSASGRRAAHFYLRGRSQLTRLHWMSLCFRYTVHRANWVTVQELNDGRMTEAFILLSHKPQNCPWEADLITHISDNSAAQQRAGLCRGLFPSC